MDIANDIGDRWKVGDVEAQALAIVTDLVGYADERGAAWYGIEAGMFTSPHPVTGFGPDVMPSAVVWIFADGTWDAPAEALLAHDRHMKAPEGSERAIAQRVAALWATVPPWLRCRAKPADVAS